MIRSLFYFLLMFCIAFSVSAPLFSAPGKKVVKRRNMTFTPSQIALQQLHTDQLSLEKEAFIRSVIRGYIDAGEDIMNKDVDAAIRSDVARTMLFNPKQKGDLRSRMDLMAEARKSILSKFPKTVQKFRTDLEAEIAPRYTMFKRNTPVTVRYQRGPKTFVVKGIYYGYNGHSVKIGGRNVPYYDIVQEDKLRIDKQYRDQVYNDYVDTRVNDYRERRSDALLSAVSRLAQQQMADNQKAGYVNYYDTWLSADALTRHLVERERIKISALNAGNISDEDKLLLSIDKPKEADVVAKVEKRRKEIAKLSPLDADQGYGSSIFWGFTRGETKMALQLFSNILIRSREDYDYFYSANRQVKDIRLEYNDNKLCRVTTSYNDIRSFQDFARLRANYIRQYGLDDDAKKGKVSRPDEVGSLTWTGKYTKAVLEVKYNTEDDVIDSISFIKEDVSNPLRPKKTIPIVPALPGKK